MKNNNILNRAGIVRCILLTCLAVGLTSCKSEQKTTDYPVAVRTVDMSFLILQKSNFSSWNCCKAPYNELEVTYSIDQPTLKYQQSVVAGYHFDKAKHYPSCASIMQNSYNPELTSLLNLATTTIYIDDKQHAMTKLSDISIQCKSGGSKLSDGKYPPSDDYDVPQAPADYYLFNSSQLFGRLLK